jgi:hypothetical protein
METYDRVDRRQPLRIPIQRILRDEALLLESFGRDSRVPTHVYQDYSPDSRGHASLSYQMLRDVWMASRPSDTNSS